jgi:uncharacterized protein (DUF488 family)
VTPIYTIGHSTRPLEELVSELASAGVRGLVDVRSVPRSRRNPQFDRDALAAELPARGIAYRHEPALGGFRRPRSDSANRGWDHAGFRGYADYMETPEFAAAVDQLQEHARKTPVCVMCAEAQWWRCHRRLLADALVVRGWTVLHLGLSREPVCHELTPFAIVRPGPSITYPPVQTELPIGSA